MKLFDTRLHGSIDYIMGGFLIISPWLFAFANNHISTWIPVLLGTAVILNRLLTDYEYGYIPEISKRTHLVMDATTGVFLVASPWIFNFNEQVFLPHLFVGLIFMITSVSTSTLPTVARKRKPL